MAVPFGSTKPPSVVEEVEAAAASAEGVVVIPAAEDTQAAADTPVAVGTMVEVEEATVSLPPPGCRRTTTDMQQVEEVTVDVTRVATGVAEVSLKHSHTSLSSLITIGYAGGGGGHYSGGGGYGGGRGGGGGGYDQQQGGGGGGGW